MQQVEQIANQIFSRLDAALAAATPAAKHAYDVLVRQQLIDGVIWAVLGAPLAFLLAAVVFRMVRRAMKSKYPDEGVIAIGSIVILALIGLGVACVAKGVSALLNPEYGAIKELIGIVK